jgi:presenilin-like A22 family membrane protease
MDVNEDGVVKEEMEDSSMDAQMETSGEVATVADSTSPHTPASPTTSPNTPASPTTPSTNYHETPPPTSIEPSDPIPDEETAELDHGTEPYQPPVQLRKKPKKQDESFTMENVMAGFRNEKHPVSFIAIVFLLVPILSILIAPTFVEEDVKAFGDNEESYVNPIIYLVLIMAFTFLILMIAKYAPKQFIQYIILGAFFVTMIYAFYPLLTYVPGVSIDTAVFIGFIMSASLTILLIKHPEWYVVDATGIAVGVGVTSIVGISFAPGPIILLMVILAVYDAISVYKTKHMIDLADNVMEFNLPVLLVVPKKKNYSFKKEKGLKEQLDSGRERDALFIGLGDIIFPSAFAVSLSVYLEDNVGANTEILGIPGIAFVVAGVILGTLLGYITLMAFVLRGRPQAGLPLLNGGAILGYLIPVLAIYHTLGLW